ncbi:MAG: hypothetical protein O2819_01190 [Planctomycetota bacterium]|nr:hypothetical protein [Planctomycetota bacterium]
MADRTDLTIDPTCVAVIAGAPSADAEAITVKLLVVRAGAEVLHADGAASLDSLRATLAQWRCGRLVAILPSGSTLCPGIPLPTEDFASAVAAAALQREMLVAQGTPAHRIAVAAAQSIHSKAGRYGLATSWLPCDLVGSWARHLSAAIRPWKTSRRRADTSIRLSFVAPAALAFAAVDAAAAEASSPVVALWLEPTSTEDGEPALDASITVSGASLAACRTTRLELEEAGSIGSAVRRFVTETAAMAGWPDATTAAAAMASEAIPPGTLPTLHGIGFSVERLFGGDMSRVTVEVGWWESFGPMMVAARMASPSIRGSDAAGTMASLATLQSEPPRERRGLIGRTILALQQPHRAWRVAVAAVLVMALAPMALEGARLVVLQSACGDEPALKKRVAGTQARLAMYRDADKHAWSMTKLLADLSAVTPDGIELRSIRVTHGGEVVLRGEAKPAGGSSGSEAILEMERLMYASHVFDKVRKDWDPADGRGITKFRLEAGVSRPSLMPDYPAAQDYAVKTMRERRYGPAEDAELGVGTVGATTAASSASSSGGGEESPEASAPVTPSELVPPDANGATPGEPTRTASAGGRERGGGGAAEGVARRGAPVTRTGGGEDEIPQPLTDAQVEGMTYAEAQAALPLYATARNKKGIDDETKVRLRSDFDRLMDQLKKLKPPPPPPSAPGAP